VKFESRAIEVDGSTQKGRHGSQLGLIPRATRRNFVNKSELKKIIANIDQNIQELNDFQCVESDYISRETLSFLISIHKVQRCLYTERLSSKGSHSDHLLSLQLMYEISEADVIRLVQAFETYIGTTSSLRSRFELGYLLNIQRVVLLDCLAVVRRADYLIENGLSTSVAVSADSIVVPMQLKATGAVTASDIMEWASFQPRIVLANVDESRWAEIERAGSIIMMYFDNALSDFSLDQFVENKLAPSYTKPEFLYYNPLLDRPAEFHGHKIHYIEPSAEHLWPGF
jgi:hypothetical protein